MPSRTFIVRLLRWSAIVLAGLLVLLAGLRLAAGTAPGRWLVMSVLDGREIGGQTLSLEGLEGDPLSRFTIDRLTVADTEGVWLEAQDIAIDWRGSSLIFRPYEITRARIARISVDRRPATPGETSRSGGSGIPDLPAIRLGMLDIAELVLAEGVAGPSARIRVDASAEIGGRDGAHLQLDAERLDAPGDSLTADLRVDNDGISGNLAARGEPDGPLATLLRLPGRTIRADGTIAGDLDSGRGTFGLAADGQDMASAEAVWGRETWRAEGRIDVQGWGVIPDSYRDLAGDTDIVLEGRRRPDLVFTEARAETDSGSATFAPAGDGAWTVTVQAQPGTVAALTSGRVIAREVRWSGLVQTGGGTLHLDGEVDAGGVSIDHVTAERMSGPLDVLRENGLYTIRTRLNLEGPQLSVDRANPLLGRTATVDFEGAWDRRDRAIDIARFLAESAHARLEANGRYLLGGRDPQITARLTVQDVARLTGQASGPLDVTLDAGSRRRAELSFDASGIDWAQTHADLLAGLAGSLTVERGETGWHVQDAVARASGIDLRGEGQTQPGGWVFEGDLAVSGRLPIEPVDVDGALATAFRARSRNGRIEVRSATRSESVAAGPVTVNNPNLAVETIWQNGVLDADWLLEATRNGKPVSLSGTAHLAGNTWSARLEESQLGAFRVSASADRSPAGLQAAFDMELGDRARSSLRYDAPPDALRDGVLDAELIVSGHAFSGGYLAEATLRLDGPLSGLDVRATATGRLRSPLTLNARGRLALAEDGGVDLTLTPSGRWSIHRIRTPQPLELHFANGDYEASGMLRIGGGDLDWRYARTGSDAALNATLAALPVAVIADIAAFPPADGLVSGETALQRRDGLWQGDARLGIADLTALAAEGAEPIAVEARLDVGEDTRVDLDLTGNGLTGSGFLTRRGPTPRLGMIAGQDGSAITGRLAVNGDITGVAALFIPAEVVVNAGDLNAEVELGGIRGSPELEGRLELTGGDVTAAATGATIRDIDLAAQFDGDGLDLTRLSATDGDTGQLTGSGALRLPTEGARGEASLAFEQFTAARRTDLTLQASGDADIALDERGLLITGAARVDRARVRPTLNGAASIPEIDVQEVNLPKGRQRYSRNVLPVRIDYSVEADRNIYISSSTFSSEWGLDIEASGAVGKPELTGQATLLDGTAFVFNRRFSLDGGQVVFDGAPGDARADLTASHERPGFSATAHIEGPVRSPSITLTSEPALPEDEILSRLLFDESVSELGAFEAAQLAAQLSGQSLLNIVGQLRDMAGIDRLSVSTDADGNLAVTGGVRLGEDVYVEVGTAGATALGQALVEWQLTPDLSVLSRLSADTDASVSIRWRRDY
jgi:translocation and assembly module TamB